jgi:TolB protein
MPPRTPLPLRRIAPLALALAVSAVGPATGQQGLDIRVDAPIRALKVAIPPPLATGASQEMAREIVSTLRGDLDFSEFFDVIDPALYRLAAREDGSIDHEAWLSIDADSTIWTQVEMKDGRLEVTLRLHNNSAATVELAQLYGGSPEHVRRVAHKMSSDVMKQVFGREGVFLTRIAFVSNHEEGKELYLMDYDGARVRRLTTTRRINLTPVWSPDGQRMAFLSYKNRQPGVYIYGVDGSLTQAPVVEAELNGSPDWSPDGTQMVYVTDKDHNAELYLLDLPTGRNTRLTRTRAIETAPAFSPNGREIAFTSDRSGSPQVYIMGKDGLNVRRVSREGGYNESPAWSPQGDRLAYVSRIGGRFDVVVLELASGQLRRLTHGERGEGNNENPAWSPDGRNLVFASDRLGTYDIYTMRWDGSRVQRLTKNGNCFTPHWSP